jgi:hypothetical protein
MFATTGSQLSLNGWLRLDAIKEKQNKLFKLVSSSQNIEIVYNNMNDSMDDFNHSIDIIEDDRAIRLLLNETIKMEIFDIKQFFNV